MRPIILLLSQNTVSRKLHSVKQVIKSIIMKRYPSKKHHKENNTGKKGTNGKHDGEDTSCIPHSITKCFKGVHSPGKVNVRTEKGGKTYIFVVNLSNGKHWIVGTWPIFPKIANCRIWMPREWLWILYANVLFGSVNPHVMTQVLKWVYWNKLYWNFLYV